MRQYILYTFVFLFVINHSTFAQDFRKYSNEFLRIGVSARAMGLGNAVVATSNDGTSGYWNPAGLVNISSKFQVNLLHSEYFAGIGQYNYGSFAMPTETGVFGVSIIRFGIDDIQNTIDIQDPNGNINYDRIKKFSAADYGFLFSYAKRDMFLEGLNIGATVKLINRSIGDFAKAYGFGIDLGAQYKRGKWQFGAVAKDITTTFNAWSYSLDNRTKEVFRNTGNTIPEDDIELTAPSFSLGVARKFIIKNDFCVQPELNSTLTFDGQRPVILQSEVFNFDPNLGIEAGYKEVVYVRVGVNNIQKSPEFRADGSRDDFQYLVQPAFGLGLHIQNLIGRMNLSVDYALTNAGEVSGSFYSNVFSLRFDWLDKSN